MSERKRIFGVTGGAVGLGGLAAVFGACCAAPWAVAVLGVSGAVTFARLAKHQPLALIIAAALLGLAFFWAYRREPVCEDGSCETDNRRRLRWVVWVAALLFAVFAVLSFVPALWPFSSGAQP